MESKIILNLESVLPSSKTQCLSAARWIYKQSDEIRFKVKDFARNEYFEMKSLYPEALSGVLADAAFLIAAFKFKRAYKDGIVVEGAAIQLSEIDDLKVETSKKTRKSSQMDWLDRHYSDVMKMVKKGMSLREMKQFFWSKRGHEISHSQISNFIKKRGMK